ncbi:acyl--CoA ligase [Endozoicomonas sp. Mp262]|uniref:AMP-binding protein n=1 Tax=Endozoicomonas sp. Mp262 TaxID=2919499 RepID=UPI0021DA6857
MSFLSSIVGHPAQRLAIVDGEKAYSYGDIVQQARCLAALLKAEGVVPGEAVACIAFERGSVIITMLGIWLAGAIAVSYNPLLMRTVLKEHLGKLGGERLVSGSPEFEDYCTRAELKGLGCISLGDNYSPLPLKTMPLDQCAMIQCLGQEAEALKAVSYSFRALAARANILGRVWAVQPGDRVFSMMPFSHAFGLFGVLAVMAAGATCQLIARGDGYRSGFDHNMPQLVITDYPEALSMMGYWQTVTRHQATGHCLKLAMVDSSWKVLPEIITKGSEADRLCLMAGYGLAETGALFSPGSSDLCSRGVEAQLLPGVSIRLVDEQGKVTQSGPGILEVRSPQLFSEYSDNASLTRSVFNHGWFTTGKYAELLQNGACVLLEES